MVRYTKLQKEIFSGSYMELANLALATLIFGQVIERRFSWIITTAGVVLYLILHAFSYFVTNRE